MKITLTDIVSNHATESEFNLTLKDKCSENVLSLNGELTEITYVMNSGDSPGISTSVSMTINDASCTLSYKLQFQNDSNDWEDYETT